MPQPDDSLVSYPKVLIWLLTARCSLECCHCYAARFLGGKELSKGEALRVVESAAKAGIKHIGFSGGEVFLRQDALDVIGRAFGLGMSTTVWLLTEQCLAKKSLKGWLTTAHVLS